jgi:PRC-barrel domain
MFEAENIRDWRNHDVVDPDGHKIGTLEAVYVDTGTDQPAWASVRTGIIGRHRLDFVPLQGAVVTPDAVKITFSRSQVKGVLSIDMDGELLAEDEPKLFEHYGLEYLPGAGGERRLGRR